MKMKALIINIVLAVILILPQTLNGQKNAKSIGVGWGLFQGFYMNANYYYTENSSLELGIGSHFGLPPFEDENHMSITFENRYHFGEPYEKRIKPWVFGQQVVYWTQGSDEVTWRIISVAPTIGVNLAFSSHILMYLDFGPSVNLVVDVDKPPMSEDYGWMWPVLFNIRGQFIYRF